MNYTVMERSPDFVEVNDSNGIILKYETAESIERITKKYMEFAIALRELHTKQEILQALLGDGKITELLAVARCNQLVNLKIAFQKFYSTNEELKFLVTYNESGWDAICMNSDYTKVFGPVELKNKHITIHQTKNGNSRGQKSDEYSYKLEGQFKFHPTQKYCETDDEVRQLIVDKHLGIPAICSMTNMLYHENIVGDIHVIFDVGVLLDTINQESEQRNTTLRINVASVYGDNKHSNSVGYQHIEPIVQ